MSKRPTIPIDRAILDYNLMGAAFGKSETWSRWLSVLRGAFSLPLSAEDRKAFAEVTGDREPPQKRVNELWCVLGRRSGKTRMAAAISVYIGAIEQHRLAPGETGYVLLLAASRPQARVAFDYVTGLLNSSPILRREVASITADEIRLNNGVIIGTLAASHRTIRGRTLLAVVGDETAFWRDETSAYPDIEIFRACAPALAASGGMWVGISTGYRKTGLLFDRHRDHFGQNSADVLVVQGASEQFNPTLGAGMIARAKSADPEAAGSEWLGEFRSDINAFLDDAIIEACVDPSRPLELPPRNLVYRAFCDPSGGRHDAFTLGIAHKTGDTYILDVLRGRRPPFDPQAVVDEFAQLLKAYKIGSVTGDNYSAAWAETAFGKAGIRYERSELNKSQLYLEVLPHFMRCAISIPDHPKLLRELRLLERRTSRMGKDIVDHGRNGSDDFANACVGAINAAVSNAGWDPLQRWVDGPDASSKSDFEQREAHRRAQLFAYVSAHERGRC